MQIEKNVPIPQTTSAGRKSKYPFGEMEVGDSIFVPGESTTNSMVYRAAHSFARSRGGLKFSARAEGDGIRIWRIK